VQKAIFYWQLPKLKLQGRHLCSYSLCLLKAKIPGNFSSLPCFTHIEVCAPVGWPCPFLPKGSCLVAPGQQLPLPLVWDFPQKGTKKHHGGMDLWAEIKTSLQVSSSVSSKGYPVRQERTYVANPSTTTFHVGKFPFKAQILWPALDHFS
jgi:hypothetical protein